ncbi:hypothetical protein QJS66_05415 [Kocuria rhizophila]|nr:hypothetical protein QJS66_05415 [Kocuria rhizophila]
MKVFDSPRAWRGSAPVGCARRGRDHVLGPADRTPPRSCAASRTVR